MSKLSAAYLATIIERAAQPMPSSGLPVGAQTPLSAHHFNAHHDRAKLLEEVARLQALIKQAEWGGTIAAHATQEWDCCPWCDGEREPYGDKPAGHEPTCPAFGSEA
jgi:hypothetical protein